MSYQGNPCWYELGTSNLNGAADFYSRILGWQVVDSGMQGFDYRLAKSGDDMVAGLMSTTGEQNSPPPYWRIYFAVDDCDKSAADIIAAGGKLLQDPADIPGTGRFAIALDPQGAAFGILQPDMSQMSEADRAKAEAGEGAFNQNKAGHGNWNELMSSDPEGALAFYFSLFGWSKGDAMDMGEMGAYQMVRHKGVDIGAIMGLGNSPVPAWLPYFGVDEPATAAVEAITSAGGRVDHGPVEVPGPAYIAIAQDPQGAWFAVVSAKK